METITSGSSSVMPSNALKPLFVALDGFHHLFSNPKAQFLKLRSEFPSADQINRGGSVSCGLSDRCRSKRSGRYEQAFIRPATIAPRKSLISLEPTERLYRLH